MMYKKNVEATTTNEAKSERTTMNVQRSTLNALNGLQALLKGFGVGRISQNDAFNVSLAIAYRLLGEAMPPVSTDTAPYLEDIPHGILNGDYIATHYDGVLGDLKALTTIVEGIAKEATAATDTAATEAATALEELKAAYEAATTKAAKTGKKSDKAAATKAKKAYEAALNGGDK